MKFSQKHIKICFFYFILLLTLAGCSTKYHEKNFLGKTSAQIEAEFGLFDCCGMPVSNDGLYRNTACGYTIKEPKKQAENKNIRLLIRLMNLSFMIKRKSTAKYIEALDNYCIIWYFFIIKNQEELNNEEY